MLRYLRLYAYFLRFSFSRAMEFRLDFFFRIVMDCWYYAVNIMFFGILYRHTNLLGGWNEHQIFVFIGVFILIDALHMTFFSNNCWWLPIYVNKGDLDYYLVRPVSSFFFLALRDFAANSFMNLTIAGSIFVYAMRTYPQPFGWGAILGGILLTALATLLYFFVHWLMILPVFWTHSARGGQTLFFMFSRFIERPDRIYTGVTRVFLLTVAPFAVMANYPARLLVEPFSFGILFHLLAATAGFGLLAVWVWNRALGAYVSASS